MYAESLLHRSMKCDSLCNRTLARASRGAPGRPKFVHRGTAYDGERRGNFRFRNKSRSNLLTKVRRWFLWFSQKWRVSRTDFITLEPLSLSGPSRGRTRRFTDCECSYAGDQATRFHRTSRSRTSVEWLVSCFARSTVSVPISFLLWHATLFLLYKACSTTYLFTIVLPARKDTWDNVYIDNSRTRLIQNSLS